MYVNNNIHVVCMYTRPAMNGVLKGLPKERGVIAYWNWHIAVAWTEIRRHDIKMVSYFANARLISTFPDEVRLPQLVQLANPGAAYQCFPKVFCFDGLTPKTILLIPRNSSPIKKKTKRTGTWRRTQIIPVLSPQLGFYAVLIGSLSQTFRDKISVPSSKTKLTVAWAVKVGPTGCPETSLKNCRSTLRKIHEERRSHLYRGRSLKSRILLYYQLPDKKRDISRDIWNCSRRFEIFIHLFYDFLWNPNDVLWNPVWKTLP
jgi:hypothetical protein